jgi:hypothetical protein
MIRFHQNILKMDKFILKSLFNLTKIIIINGQLQKDLNKK